MDTQHIQKALEKIEGAKDLLKEALRAMGHGDESVMRDMTRNFFRRLYGQLLHKTQTCYVTIALREHRIYTIFEASPHVACDIFDHSGERRICSVKADPDDQRIVHVWFTRNTAEETIVIDDPNGIIRDNLHFAAFTERTSAKTKRAPLDFFPPSIGEDETNAVIIPRL